MAPFSLGVTFDEASQHTYQVNGYTPQDLLDKLDTFNNMCADAWGYAHGSLAAYKLYPALYRIDCGITHNHDINAAPLGSAFPYTVLMDGLRERGVTPVIWMQPGGNGRVGDDPGGASDGSPIYADMKRWTNGLFDGLIHDWRELAVAWAHNANSVGFNRQGLPKSNAIIIRWAQEMNATWFNWRLGAYENSTYWVPAWQRLWRLLKGNLVPAGHERATFVSLFFCPWDERKTGSITHSFEQCYPGDAYTDYVGSDIYQWTDPAPAMSDCYKLNLDNMWAVTHKPVIVGETTTVDPGSNISNWLTLNDSNMAAVRGGVAWTANHRPSLVSIHFSSWAPDLRLRPIPLGDFAHLLQDYSDPPDQYVKAKGLSSGAMGLGGVGQPAPGSLKGYVGLGGASGVFTPKTTFGLSGGVGISGTSVPFRTGSGAGAIGITGHGAEHVGDESDLYLYEGDDYVGIEAIYENSLP